MDFTQDSIDRQARAAVPTAASIIDGRLAGADTGRTFEVITPIDGSVLAQLPDCGAADVDRAVAAARRCFDRRDWAGMPPKARKAVMRRWADLVAGEAFELSVLQTRDMGAPVSFARELEIANAIDTLQWYAEVPDKLYDEFVTLDDNVTARILRAPLGVVGAILPWNAPAMIGAWKIAPALAVGNSVVVKPSEAASLVMLRICELALEAGLPAGALQCVTGAGEVGTALSEHMDVDCLTFTGSGGTGRRIMEASARSNLKRVALELGGKSANIVFADAADLDFAAAVATGFMFSNQGQVCEAPSRLLVQRPIADDFLDRLTRKAAALKVGDPLKLGTDMGPIISRNQYEAILEHIRKGEAQGGRLTLDGRNPNGAVTGGHYIGATIADNIAPEDHLAQEEVFGPVLTVIPFDSEKDALRIANGTRYGLGASIWSSNVDTVSRVSRDLVAGNINVNGGVGPVVELPFGGFKQSGFGRDRSLHAVDKYCDLKNVVIRTQPRLA